MSPKLTHEPQTYGLVVEYKKQRKQKKTYTLYKCKVYRQIQFGLAQILNADKIKNYWLY